MIKLKMKRIDKYFGVHEAGNSFAEFCMSNSCKTCRLHEKEGDSNTCQSRWLNEEVDEDEKN